MTGSFKSPLGKLYGKGMAPTKVNCFLRIVIKKACFTHETLQRRKIQITSRCSLCMEAAETNSHLFLHCKVTSPIWAIFFCLAREDWTMPEHNAHLLSCYIRKGGM